MPTISVVVPVYKVEPYLRRCVDSILNQSYTDFELILVDDGSPDNCPAICDEYAARDSRVHVIHQPNGGLSAARNSGLNVAAGKYIYFVDSDDWIDDSLLETIVPFMDAGNDLAVFGYYCYQNNTLSPAIHFQDTKDFCFRTQEEIAQFLSGQLITYRIGWGAWSRIFRRDVIEQHHLRFADNRKIFAEDIYFSLCYCSHVHKIKCIDTPLYYYRIRDDSIMGVQAAVLNAGRMNELGKAVLQHFQEQKLDPVFLAVFPLIHYLLLYNAIWRYRNLTGASLRSMYGLLQEDIPDFSFFAEQMRKVKHLKKYMRKIYSPVRTREILCSAAYYADGKKSALYGAETVEKAEALKKDYKDIMEYVKENGFWTILKRKLAGIGKR